MSSETVTTCDFCGRQIDDDRVGHGQGPVQVIVYGGYDGDTTFDFHRNCADKPLRRLRESLQPSGGGS